MRHLMLLRHAKTERDSPSGLDQDRRLSAVGRADAPAIGRYVGARHLIPDLVLVSPAARARETWELFAAELATVPPSEFVADLYGADPAQLSRIARMADAFAHKSPIERLMIVAHNPGLHEFALALTANGGKDREALAGNLPTGALTLIECPIANWSDLSFGGGRLERLILPSMLRQKN